MRATEVRVVICVTCTGDFTKQRYLASMEGAVFSGKLVTQAIVEVQFKTPLLLGSSCHADVVF